MKSSCIYGILWAGLPCQRVGLIVLLVVFEGLLVVFEGLELVEDHIQPSLYRHPGGPRYWVLGAPATANLQHPLCYFSLVFNDFC